MERYCITLLSVPSFDLRAIRHQELLQSMVRKHLAGNAVFLR